MNSASNRLQTVLPNGKRVILQPEDTLDVPESLSDCMARHRGLPAHVRLAIANMVPALFPHLDARQPPLAGREFGESCQGAPDWIFMRKDAVGVDVVHLSIHSDPSSELTMLETFPVYYERSQSEWGPIRQMTVVCAHDDDCLNELEWPNLPGVPVRWFGWPSLTETLRHSRNEDPVGYEVHLLTIVRASRQILQCIARDPALLSGVDDRRFEELVATVLFDLGFDDVELTPPRQDGGIDIIVRHQSPRTGLVETYLFECKHWTSGHLVTARWAFSLLDVVRSMDAKAGILVSSAGFGPKLLEAEATFRKKGVFLKDGVAFSRWVGAWERRYGQLLMTTLDPLCVLGL